MTETATGGISARFWSKVDVRGPDECWEWQASTDDGYGRFRVEGRIDRAHRVAFQLSGGTIPDGLCVLHNCPKGDNRRCVNPRHLRTGTKVENNADRDRKGRGGHGRLCGEANPKAKLTDEQARELVTRYRRGEGSQRTLAVEYGVSHSYVSQLTSGQYRKEATA